MTTSEQLSKILTDLLAEPNRGLEQEQALLQTLNSVWFWKRANGCFFRKDDEAFKVPELQTFRDFTLELSTRRDLTNGFAILDYWLPRLPNAYINAIYLLADEDCGLEIERYARRLTALYKYPVIANKIFDSNKIITSRGHYESFVLSRITSPHNQCPEEYFVDLEAIERQLEELLKSEMHRLLNTDGDAYLKALGTVYDAIRSPQCKDRIPQILKENCSQLVCETVLEKPTRRIGDLEFDDVQSSFLMYIAFFLSITPKSKEFVYLPVQMVAGPAQTLRWVGGILMPLLKQSQREERVALRNAAQVVVSSFYSAYTDALLLQSLEKAAQAQIMSRNMSHNLGSHALARIKGSDMKDAPDDAERLLGYLQERMDFVARVATEWPAWREPVLFFGDLVRGFFKQGLLLNNLVADDGYAADQIDFYVRLPGQSSPMLFRFGKETVKGEKDTYSEFREQGKADGVADRPDLIVAIPGGPVGRQAFYGFLENALRNAAKHNRGEPPLRVFLELENLPTTDRRESSFYNFRYQDSISVVDSKPDLVRGVQRHLREGLVNGTTRQPIAEAWGIQEMKVYARYLAHPFENETVISGENRPLWAKGEPFSLGVSDKLTKNTETVSTSSFDVSSTEHTPTVLTYTFGLQSPCLAMISGKCTLPGSDDSRRRYGLEISKEGLDGLKAELLRTKAPGLLYLVLDEGESDVDELVEWLNERKHWIPARTLVWAHPSSLDKLRASVRKFNLIHRIRVDTAGSPLTAQNPTSGGDEQGVKNYLVQVYHRWLIALAEERGIATPFNVVIYFDREKSPYPQRWADLGKSVMEFGLAEMIKVFPLGKAFASTEDRKDLMLSEPWKVLTHYWHKGDRSEESLGDIKVEEGAKGGSWLIFDNHGNARPQDVVNQFYQYVGGYSTDGSQFPNNRDAFDRLSEVPNGFVGVLSLMQLVEACLLKVLILDERVAGTALELKRTDKERLNWKLRWKASLDSDHFGQTIASKLQDSGIYFAPFFHETRGNESNRFCALNADGEVSCEIEGALLWEVEMRGSRAVDCKALGTNAKSLVGSKGDGPFFDAVIIHKGLMEWLAVRIKSFDQKEFLDSLHLLGGRVIITSGRGAQMEGPVSKYPFVEFAVLENYVVRELSKASLGNVLMAVTGREETDGT